MTVRIRNILLHSPWFLLVFLIVPAIIVIRLKLHMRASGDLLLANNAAFLVCIAARLAWYGLRLKRDIRYGAECGVPSESFTPSRPLSELTGDLQQAGYRFDPAGGYGEKRDAGYLGTMLLYAGLFLVLATGSYDYMREYSVMIRSGVGEPVSLDGTGLVGQFEAGSLAATAKLPKVQIRKQILPNDQWPKGATEIALLDEDRKELAKGTIAPGKPFRFRGLEYHMARFVFDALLVLQQDRTIIYDNFVKFYPLPEKKGVYSYAGGLATEGSGPVKGGAWLNPEKKAVKIEATLDKKTIFDGEVELWGVNKRQQGKITASIDGLAQWSELRVARGRHTGLLLTGAILALIGIAGRTLIRPQRVWLERTDEGERVRAVGQGTLRRLK